MVGPGKIGAKVIEKTVTEVAKQQQFNQPMDNGASPFQNMLDSVNAGQDFASDLGFMQQDLGMPNTAVSAISADGINVDTANLGVGLDQPNGIDKVVDLLSEVNDGHMQMENVMNQILYSGQRFNNQELLAIQAHVFHFAQITELVVKTADQGVSSIKAVMNTNIQ